MALQLRRGVQVDRVTEVFEEGEIVYSRDEQSVYVGDGATPGGIFVGGNTNGENSVTLEAGQDLGADRVVISVGGLARYADLTTPGDMQNVIGITTHSAVTGADITIQTLGNRINPAWTFSDGPVYLGAAATLTQTVPAGYYVLPIGMAVDPTQITININHGILRSI